MQKLLKMPDLATNPVQKSYLRKIQELYLRNTDDLADIQNFIAALEIATKAVTHDYYEYYAKYGKIDNQTLVNLVKPTHNA